MEYTQKITLDLNSNTAPPIIYTKQGDADTRVLEIHLMEDGNEYQPPANAFAVFRMRKPDGTTIGAGVDDTTITSISNNIVFVRLSEQALAAAGRGLADILLYNGDQYLSTASFILVIQSAPVAVMRGIVSSNEYNIFENLLSSLGDTLPAVQSAVAAAVAASDSAAYWASNFNLSVGTPMQPGADPTIIGDGPAYTLRLPSIKPMAAITISESGEVATANVTVKDFEGTTPAGLDSNLIKVFDFNITLPSGRNVQIDSSLSHEGQAADASAVGQALASKYDPNSTIPLSVIGISPDNPLPIADGGTGASNAENVRLNIDAQRTIQTNNITVPSTDWTESGNYYTKTVNIPIPNSITLSAAPHFVASPNTVTSWGIAAEAEMGPPSAAYSSGASWQLTFYCASTIAEDMGVTVHWW